MVLAMAIRLSCALEAGGGVALAPAELVALFGALLTNAFGTRSGEQRGRSVDVRPSGFAVSCTASLFNHSCVVCSARRTVR
jgi:hypothetical protein